MNDQNLVPQNLRTEEERREIASKGGKASAKARSFRTAFKKAMQEVKEDKSGKKSNGFEMMARSLMSQIAKGNVKAIEFASKFLGEYHEKVNIEAEVEKKHQNRINIDDLTEEERNALLALAEKKINVH